MADEREELAYDDEPVGDESDRDYALDILHCVQVLKICVRTRHELNLDINLDKSEIELYVTVIIWYGRRSGSGEGPRGDLQ